MIINLGGQEHYLLKHYLSFTYPVVNNTMYAFYLAVYTMYATLYLTLCVVISVCAFTALDFVVCACMCLTEKDLNSLVGVILESPHYDRSKQDSFFDQCFESLGILGFGSFGNVRQFFIVRY